MYQSLRSNAWYANATAPAAQGQRPHYNAVCSRQTLCPTGVQTRCVVGSRYSASAAGHHTWRPVGYAGTQACCQTAACANNAGMQPLDTACCRSCMHASLQPAFPQRLLKCTCADIKQTWASSSELPQTPHLLAKGCAYGQVNAQSVTASVDA